MLVWAQHLSRGACWVMGWRLRALEVERSPPTFPSPQARMVSDTSKAAQIPVWPGTGNTGNTGLPKGGCGLVPGWLQALSPKSGQVKGTPRAGSISLSKQENVVTAAPTWGWWQEWSLLGHPPVPSPTLSKGVDSRAEPTPGELACQADGEGRNGEAGHFGISKADT